VRPVVRFAFESLVRLYFPSRSLAHPERLPRDGRRILVANHPNGLLDPLVLRMLTSVPARFLGKSTLFKNPFMKYCLDSFGGIPVYRRQDVGEGDEVKDANEKTFALCRAALARGEPLALFPEGISHTDAKLQPLKTGAARIALSYDEECGGDDTLVIVPVALEYSARSTFRSGVLGAVGAPIAVRDFRERYREDPRATVDALTEAISFGLQSVLVQASTREVLEGVARVAVWTGDPSLREDPDARHVRAKILADEYARLEAEEPERADAIVREVREYDRILRALGVEDPWGLEVGRVRSWPALRVAARLVAMAPFALVGAALGWVPYRLVRVVAARVTPHEDVLGTVKLLGGMLFVGLTWIVEAVLAAVFLGWQYALALLVIAPLGGYLALRFDEERAMAITALGHAWFRWKKPLMVQRLVERRESLAAQVANALDPKNSSAQSPERG
jgi:glycerol-3-phosphate O-acyltransferase/dihydroxyacetone phosphate acyltransferase